MMLGLTREHGAQPKPIGTQATAGRNTWVQTEREAHEEWAKLSRENAAASSLLHTLVARMAERNALVIHRRVLAQLMNCSPSTVKRATAHLVEHRWIEVVQIGKGGANAYIVNSRVAWGQKRELLPTATFTAEVIVSAEDQDVPPSSIEHRELRKLPVFVPRTNVEN